MVEASQIFAARQSSWQWPNLTRLTLTSLLLAPGQSTEEVDDILTEAAAAARRMPRLETMETWNGEMGVAMLFRYKRPERERRALLIPRGTFRMTL